MVCDIKGKSLSLLQDIPGCGMADFIYQANCSPQEMADALSILSQNYKMRLRLISHNSLILKSIQLLSPTLVPIPSNSVAIHFGDDYDAYFRSLSKNARQNVRTSYNRIAAKNVSLDLRIYGPNDSKYVEIESLFKLYYRRRSTKYANGKTLAPISSFLASHFKHDSISLKKSPLRFFTALYLDNKPAAVMLGFIDPINHSFYVPRLAIDDSFKFFSPGILLINETIKYLTTNTDIRTLDLTKGDEKYKFQMGGDIYNTYSITL